MKTKWIYLLLLSILFGLIACQEPESNSEEQENEEGSTAVILTESKLKNLDLNIGKVEKMMIYKTVQANGKLSVPPHNSALITAIVGANIQDIFVLEGEKVKKGQTLALIAHPNLIQMQTDFLKKTEELNFLESEYNRRKTMFEENAISGKALLEAETQYKSKRAEVNGLQKQLQQLQVEISKLKTGEIIAQIPVKSPIDGFIERIFVQIGQYVSEQQPMFSVLNNNHLHADLLVYEKNADKVKIGQKVIFHTQSSPTRNYKAQIIAVSKSFEEQPKAIHIHADIDDKENTANLIAGMFIEGSIITDSTNTFALSERAVVIENNEPVAFTAKKVNDNWQFEPVLLTNVVKQDSFYVFNNKPTDDLFVRNNAYYIISELKKDEMEHDD
ncbi:MAG TPA: efflux transporter periplasmic adaptor subunit [Flavobacteriales bacterium]|nr:efflux transporter periplasmic adaptor subunit [Flavobacteriales bacterium]|tara:strand:+ start:81146 stop:82306 length:1161 start_codon:yes stop_codon:yes gene_type:complete